MPASTDKAAELLDQLAALDTETRREVAAGLKKLAETVAVYRDGKRASHTLGFLADLIDPPKA
jgi:hypothetical protein